MKRLKQLRMERNIRQKEIADYLGITVSAYGNYELGQRQPNFEILCKMADFFNVSVDYLLGRENKNNSYSPSPIQLLYDQLNEAHQEIASDFIYLLLILENKEDYARFNAFLKSGRKFATPEDLAFLKKVHHFPKDKDKN